MLSIGDHKRNWTFMIRRVVSSHIDFGFYHKVKEGVDGDTRVRSQK